MQEEINQGELCERFYYKTKYCIFEGLKAKSCGSAHCGSAHGSPPTRDLPEMIMSHLVAAGLAEGGLVPGLWAQPSLITVCNGQLT